MSGCFASWQALNLYDGFISVWKIRLRSWLLNDQLIMWEYSTPRRKKNCVLGKHCPYRDSLRVRMTFCSPRPDRFSHKLCSLQGSECYVNHYHFLRLLRLELGLIVQKVQIHFMTRVVSICDSWVHTIVTCESCVTRTIHFQSAKTSSLTANRDLAVSVIAFDSLYSSGLFLWTCNTTQQHLFSFFWQSFTSSTLSGYVVTQAEELLWQ